MECAMCGESGFNRILVDVYEGDELGGLCSDCETDAEGLPTGASRGGARDGCAACPRDGHVAIPMLDCYIEHGETELTEYEITAETPKLCFSCVDDVFPGIRLTHARVGNAST